MIAGLSIVILPKNHDIPAKNCHFYGKKAVPEGLLSSAAIYDTFHLYLSEKRGISAQAA